jgi:hypothetical protein
VPLGLLSHHPTSGIDGQEPTQTIESNLDKKSRIFPEDLRMLFCSPTESILTAPLSREILTGARKVLKDGTVSIARYLSETHYINELNSDNSTQLRKRAIAT